MVTNLLESWSALRGDVKFAATGYAIICVLSIARALGGDKQALKACAWAALFCCLRFAVPESYLWLWVIAFACELWNVWLAGLLALLGGPLGYFTAAASLWYGRRRW